MIGRVRSRSNEGSPMTVPDPHGRPESAAPGESPADAQLDRRAVVGRLAYVVPVIVALEVARPAVALGRSGPAATRGGRPDPAALPATGVGPTSPGDDLAVAGGLGVAAALAVAGLATRRRAGSPAPARPTIRERVLSRRKNEPAG
jgi:hypothetical protein